jgi:sporulation protein YlmC with PRC-barrel domain
VLLDILHQIIIQKTKIYKLDITSYYIIIQGETMDAERKYSRQLMGKKVVTKTGKVFGEVNNMVFDTKTGEILQLSLRNTTSYCDGLDLERTKQGEVLVPYSAVVATGDFIVLAEEEIL